MQMLYLSKAPWPDTKTNTADCSKGRGTSWGGSWLSPVLLSGQPLCWAGTLGADGDSSPTFCPAFLLLGKYLLAPLLSFCFLLLFFFSLKTGEKKDKTLKTCSSILIGGPGKSGFNFPKQWERGFCMLCGTWGHSSPCSCVSMYVPSLGMGSGLWKVAETAEPSSPRSYQHGFAVVGWLRGFLPAA